MVIPQEFEKYKKPSEDCPRYNKNNPDYRCSVDYDKSNYRKTKAKEEADKEKVSIFEICNLTNSFLNKIGIESRCILIDGLDVLTTINYEHIRHLYKLKRQSDIVWFRFTTDGYLGVVASSNDINFDYDTNSGKIIKSVNKEWDEKKIVIVPLPEIAGRRERLQIETMLGNYLSDNKVPIIDLYSHNLGR
ncbi:hypothetical protein MKA58_11885 [[Clostridium] innocuum]|nr:hypothetical protein [[Clostridium] innocuum]